MHFATAFVLGVASLATAAPTSGNPSTLAKRHLASSGGPYDSWSPASNADLLTAMSQIDTNFPGSSDVPGWISHPSQLACVNGVNIVLSVDPTPAGQPASASGLINVPKSVVMSSIKLTYKDIYQEDIPTNGGQSPAFQFWGPGWNLLMKGQPDCANIPIGTAL